MIISQVMLINRSRLATYANHANVAHAMYDITSCHDYKIANVIQELVKYNHHIISCSRFERREQASSISEDVAKIQINSQPCKGNNLTTRHTRATKANKWQPFAMTIKESGRVIPRPSAIFYVKTLSSSPWLARTLSLLIICEAR
jgi:hypothetical protein